jgi:hypothetical protein
MVSVSVVPQPAAVWPGHVVVRVTAIGPGVVTLRYVKLPRDGLLNARVGPSSSRSITVATSGRRCFPRPG